MSLLVHFDVVSVTVTYWAGWELQSSSTADQTAARVILFLINLKLSLVVFSLMC